MLYKFVLFARRGGGNEEVNSWLDKNPMVLGLCALVLGLVIGGWGVFELLQGEATDKRGGKHTGGSAMALAIIRIVAGVGVVGFGIYKMIAG